MTLPSPALDGAIAATTLKALGEQREFDAIVVGAGAAGGMAALLLSEAGLKVLVLDAGWQPNFLRAPIRQGTSALVQRLADPRWIEVLPFSLTEIGRKCLKVMGRIHRPIQTKCFAWEQAPESFVDDRKCPYVTEEGTEFNWFRARQIGGRMTIPGHGRQYFRLSAHDLEPPDGLSAAWPVSLGELIPWYDLVEKRLGLSGRKDNCHWVPDSRLKREIEPTPAERELSERLVGRWPGVKPLMGRSAPPHPSLEVAATTGRLSCRRGAIVKEVLVDARGRVRGVKCFDRESRSTRTALAPIVFLCASSLETTRILLLSRSQKSGRRLGSGSNALGRHLMDHVCVTGQGVGPGLPDEPEPPEPGRCIYVPRFDLRNRPHAKGRGFGVQLYRWSTGAGCSYVNAVSFAEMLPRPENRVRLDPRRKDAWGIPVLRISCRHSPEELAAARDQAAALREIAGLLDVELKNLDEDPPPPGTAIHECGTARMGDNPDTSVVDPNNQCWDANGLYVTDGAAFPTQGAQNPTLTILALTARACAHAVANGR